MEELTPIKYLVGVWKTLPGYPTREDVQYEIMQHMRRKRMSDFSEQTLNGVWYDQAGVACWRGTEHERLVLEMMEDGTFGRVRIDQAGKQWYDLGGGPEWVKEI